MIRGSKNRCTWIVPETCRCKFHATFAPYSSVTDCTGTKPCFPESLKYGFSAEDLDTVFCSGFTHQSTLFLVSGGGVIMAAGYRAGADRKGLD